MVSGTQYPDSVENWSESKLAVPKSRCPVVASSQRNKAGYTAAEDGCGWAGAIFEVKEKKS